MAMEKPFLPAFFHQMNKLMMEEHLKILSSYELTRVHVPIIMTLYENRSGLYQSELARKLYYNRAHMSRTLKDLVERSFVTLEDTSAYKNRYIISDRGIEVAEAIKVSGQNIEKRIFSVLTQEEIAEFERIIKRMTKAL